MCTARSQPPRVPLLPREPYGSSYQQNWGYPLEGLWSAGGFPAIARLPRPDRSALRYAPLSRWATARAGVRSCPVWYGARGAGKRQCRPAGRMACGGEPMPYQVEVRRAGWRRIGSDPRSGEWQVIAQELGAGQRLYVEVWRYPWAMELQVTVARLEQAVAGRGGKAEWRAIRTQRPEELALR